MAGTGSHAHASVEEAVARLAPLRALLVGAMRTAGDGAAAGTWLVGGIVRDALLGRPLVDVDIATAADPARVARAIATALDGAIFPLGDHHGCWRVVLRGGAESADADDVTPSATTGAHPVLAQIDVCALRDGDLHADLAGRDLSINALALALDGNDATIVDEHGGLDDIARGLVRAVAPSALDADPLRLLRVARFAHVLDWHVDPGTAADVRSRASRLVEPAGERVFAELQTLLLHPEARRGWRLLEQLGLDGVLLPELEACRGMAQSRFHHLDVHDHTLAVLDNCEDLLAATDFWLPLPDELGLVAAPWTQEQRLTVLLAAVCHDLGKPATRGVRADGGVSFVGHDRVGRDIVDAIAERWRWSTRLRRSVGSLVGTHLALGFVLHTPAGERERWRLRRTLAPMTAEAVVLSVGDRLATAGPDDRRKWVRAHLSLARTVWADHWREQRDGVPQPVLDGTELAGTAGIEPGPTVGELVTALAEEQAVGAVRTREEAEAFVRARASAVDAGSGTAQQIRGGSRGRRP